ncbi:MAG: fluoride efflux transporter CrcB [Clostridia bacterium]|nr:fluoride efflux transporter CrcB [Clostridia bacterium]
MRNYFFISLGGFLGAVSRFAIKSIRLSEHCIDFPINTLFINVTGSFILTLLLTSVFEILKIKEDIRLGISTGFLGAYTTFSTFCKESIELLDKGLYVYSFLYISLSVVLGLMFSHIAAYVSRRLLQKKAY